MPSKGETLDTIAAKRKSGRSNLDLILLLLLIILPIAILISIQVLAGPSWDIMERFISGRTLVNFFSSSIAPQTAFIGEFQNNQLYYFEPYREPLATPIMAVLYLIFGNAAILPYIIITFLVFAYVVWEFAKEIKMNPLIAFAVFINTYSIYFFFVLNGGESLSIIFVLIALIFMFRKSPLAGLFLGTAVLAKYQTLVLLPIVLLLGSGKKIFAAIVLELIPIGIWALMDYMLYGNPIYSFATSLSNSSTTGAFSMVYPAAVLYVLIYPITFGAIALVYYTLKKRKISFGFSKYMFNLVVALLVLSMIIWLFTLPHNDFNTQSRYGYLFVAMVLIPIALLLNNISKDDKRFKYGLAIFSIVILSGALIYTLITDSTSGVIFYNPNNIHGIYYYAASQLAVEGYSPTSCRFITNAWIPMVYEGFAAYSPFIAGSNASAITHEVMAIASNEGVNSTQYNKEILKYPIISYKYIGVQSSFIVGLNASKQVYTDKNITVNLPAGGQCYDSNLSD